MNVHLTPRAEQILNDLLSRQPERRPEEIVEQGLRAIAGAEPARRGLQKLSQDEFKAWLDALAIYSDDSSLDPSETFSREMLYADEDR